MMSRTEIILAYADRRIPRYTSYPTAPHFTSEVDADVYRSWLAAVPPGMAASLYLHVPFCRTMCWYCGCHTRATLQSEPVERYLDALELEIDLVADAIGGRLPVVHIHWGGGSPTLVRGKRFVRIMERIRSRFEVREDAEIAVEVDPRTLRDDLVEAMAASGVNRASIGVQTFDAQVQKAINRPQTYALVAKAATRLRQAGIGGMNADLLYGLPHQTVRSAEETVVQLLELAPERVSVFGYAHVPHMKKHQRLIDEAALPGPWERLAQVDCIADTLAAAGYTAVGLDHFARPDDRLAVALRTGQLHRNFQGYTTDTAPVLIGFGVSAIGSLAAGYVQNTPATGNWEAAIRSGRLPVSRGYALRPEDRMRGEIISRLMCELSADIAAIAAAHDLPEPEPDLSRLERDGIVRREGSRIVVEESFRPLARVVAAAFDAWLSVGEARHANAV